MTAVVAVVGDLDPENHTHQATNSALVHAGVGFDWVATQDLSPEGASGRLEAYSGIFVAPSSPYRNMEGALAAIEYARVSGVPLVGT